MQLAITLTRKISFTSFFVLASFMTVLLSGCASSSTFSRPVFQDPILTVRLDSPLFPGETQAEAYDHPIEFTSQALAMMLQSIRIKKEVSLLDYYVFRQDTDPKPVFPPDLAELLVPQIQTAFAKAQPEEMVVFFVNRPREDGIPLLTSGALFVRGTQLSVALANVNRPVTLERKREQAREMPLKSLATPDFHFVPGPHQTILTNRESSVGLSQSPSPLTLLIAYNQFLNTASTIKEPVNVAPSQTSENLPSSAEHKLRQLKSWYQEGLISEPEYQKKRKEILDRKSVVWGKSVDLGGRRIIKKKKQKKRSPHVHTI